MGISWLCASAILIISGIIPIVVSDFAPAILELSSGFVSLSNGLVNLTIRLPGGDVYSLSYGEISNVFLSNPPKYKGPGPPGGTPGDRGYYDWTGSNDDTATSYAEFIATSNLTIHVNTLERVVISFPRHFNSSTYRSVDIPCDVETYYSVESGIPGFYSWITLYHSPTMPAGSLGNLRYIFKLNPLIFRNTWLSDKRHREMPDWGDVYPDRSIGTNIREARLILNPTTNYDFYNEIDCKYYYLLTTTEQDVFGWVSNTTKPVGVWIVNSNKVEYASGGPLKQDLTVQTGGILLNTLHSGHVGTPPISFTKGQESSKLLGPWLVYLNSGDNFTADLWTDANARSAKESAKWPYDWVAAINETWYPGSDLRGRVAGSLVILDSFLDFSGVNFSQGWVGLASTSDPGSFTQGTIFYQFWTNPTLKGDFLLTNVRAGTYYLHAFVPGVLGQFVRSSPVVVNKGSVLNLGAVTFHAPRYGRTVWEIGVPDRDSREFFAPVLNPSCAYPYPHSNVPNKHRNYGVWEWYNRLLPSGVALRYVVGASDPSKDWWYVQPTYNVNGTYGASAWEVVFYMYSPPPAGKNYYLQFALAAVNNAAVVIRLGPTLSNSTQLFDTLKCKCANFYADNAMVRGGSYGNYYNFVTRVPSSLLQVGPNSLYFVQRKAGTQFINVMYDYIRFEGPGRG